MIHIKVIDQNGGIIINSFPVDFVKPIEGKEKNSKSRYKKENLSHGSMEILIINEERISNSNKVFNTFIGSIKMILEGSLLHNEEKAEEMADDYLHNITKIHGNQKSIIERCIFGAEGQESYNDYVLAVKNKILEKPEEFAEDICALSKEVRLVDYHIGGYKLLRDKSSRISITNNHNLKIFLLGLSHLFFDTFKKNNVVVSLHDVDENFLCSFEYETFNIALHSFFENAVKYSKPYSKIFVYTQKEIGQLVFEMESIRIEKDETHIIFERGVSGRCVPEDLRGSGIGMYLLKNSLERSGISISVLPDLAQSSELVGVKYTKNTFYFNFPEGTYQVLN